MSAHTLYVGREVVPAPHGYRIFDFQIHHNRFWGRLQEQITRKGPLRGSRCGQKDLLETDAAAAFDNRNHRRCLTITLTLTLTFTITFTITAETCRIFRNL